MASFVSDSIFAGLKTQFEDAMRSLVQKIADGEGLDEAELMSKYLVNVIPATKEAKGKAPVKERKAKVTVTPATDEKCSCLTAKGKPCALKPMFGTMMCRVHTKKAEAEGMVASGSGAGPIKEPKEPKKAGKPKKAKKVKADAPVHTHALDGEDHDDCELCQTHGNPLNEIVEEEFETVTSPRRSLRERLMRVAETEEFVDDDEA
jgi:hypothetical protein